MSDQGGGAPAGEPADVDCAKALERMFFFIDHELADADTRQIAEHLQECAPCLAKYDLERTVKMLVARSCSERAPEELRARVMLRIRQTHLRITDS